mmetsp:Transcript_19404/g.46272  ORF Transcript_19404/g.46272 Transcript_19404/m.46272 type:complete len:549 (-) Transcript_19404:1855-3501(-)
MAPASLTRRGVFSCLEGLVGDGEADACPTTSLSTAGWRTGPDDGSGVGPSDDSASDKRLCARDPERCLMTLVNSATLFRDLIVLPARLRPLAPPGCLPSCRGCCGLIPALFSAGDGLPCTGAAPGLRLSASPSALVPSWVFLLASLRCASKYLPNSGGGGSPHCSGIAGSMLEALHRFHSSRYCIRMSAISVWLTACFCSPTESSTTLARPLFRALACPSALAFMRCFRIARLLLSLASCSLLLTTARRRLVMNTDGAACDDNDFAVADAAADSAAPVPGAGSPLRELPVVTSPPLAIFASRLCSAVTSVPSRCRSFWISSHISCRCMSSTSVMSAARSASWPPPACSCMTRSIVLLRRLSALCTDLRVSSLGPPLRGEPPATGPPSPPAAAPSSPPSPPTAASPCLRLSARCLPACFAFMTAWDTSAMCLLSGAASIESSDSTSSSMLLVWLSLRLTALSPGSVWLQLHSQASLDRSSSSRRRSSSFPTISMTCSLAAWHESRTLYSAVRATSLCRSASPASFLALSSSNLRLLRSDEIASDISTSF